MVTGRLLLPSALPMFHISAMTSLVSWSLKGLAVNLCNDLKYFYRT